MLSTFKYCILPIIYCLEGCPFPYGYKPPLPPFSGAFNEA